MNNQQKFIIIGSIIVIALTYVAILYIDSFDDGLNTNTDNDIIYYDLNNHKYTEISIVALKDDYGNIILVDKKELSKNYYKAGS